MNVLFVCTGNTCRSPMAEAIARSFAGGSAVCFASAGLHAEGGVSATPHAVEAAAAFDGDAGHHWSRQIDGEMVAWADRMYVMTAEHLHGVRSRFPDAVEKAGMLDPTGADVADPYGAGIAAYLSAAGHIAMAIEARAEEWQIG